MSDAPNEPNYVIEFRPQPSAVPAPLRIRRLLKYALRSLGLKCISLQEKPKPDPSSLNPVRKSS